MKTLNSDPMHLDNFMTEEDEIGKSKLKEGEEEKRRKRQVSKCASHIKNSNGARCASMKLDIGSFHLYWYVVSDII